MTFPTPFWRQERSASTLTIGAELNGLLASSAATSFSLPSSPLGKLISFIACNQASQLFFNLMSLSVWPLRCLLKANEPDQSGRRFVVDVQIKCLEHNDTNVVGKIVEAEWTLSPRYVSEWQQWIPWVMIEQCFCISMRSFTIMQCWLDEVPEHLSCDALRETNIGEVLRTLVTHLATLRGLSSL